MPISRATLLLTLAALASCGKSDPAALKNDAFKAMDSGDAAGAVAIFDGLLAESNAQAPDYIELAVGRCQALAAVDGEKCKTEFLALAKSSGDKIDDRDYSAVASRLVSSKNFSPAIDVLEDGKVRFPESPKMQALAENVVTASKKAGDKAALGKLSSLGYLGGD